MAMCFHCSFKFPQNQSNNEKLAAASFAHQNHVDIIYRLLGMQSGARKVDRISTGGGGAKCDKNQETDPKDCLLKYLDLGRNTRVSIKKCSGFNRIIGTGETPLERPPVGETSIIWNC